MTSHGLSIAKASLLASCLRPDFAKLNRDDLAEFHSLLELTIFQCSSINIQRTKEWLCQNILPSSTRTAALGKFLITTSKNVASLTASNASTRICRRRLHILYLVNDVLHHLKHHQASFADSAEEMTRTLPALFSDTAADAGSHTKSRLKQLLTVWRHDEYCSQATIDQLTAVLSSGQPTATKQETSIEPEEKELPWVMPSTHGDPSAPFFDLPAANFMPHIIPSSKKAMRPDKVRALQLPAGAADKSLVNAVKDFLEEVKSIDDPFTALEDEGVHLHIDEIGQITHKNEAGDVVGDTYYGWSRSFCENMQQKSQGPTNRGRSSSRSRSKSRSRSRSEGRSMSRSPKRRRYSSSRSRSPSPARPGFARTSQPDRIPAQDPSRFRPQAFSSANPNTISSFQPVPQRPMAGIPFPLPVPHNGSAPPRPPHWQGPWPPPPPPPQMSQGSAYPSIPPHFGGQNYNRR